MPVDERDLTDDAVLSGRLRLLQPRGGHRFGHDAILLAAATPARCGERAVDLGTGVGAAGLAVAVRVEGARLTLVEIDPALAAIAAENAARNGLAGRVAALALDVGAPAAEFARAGLADATCDLVLMNPPFNDPGRHIASRDTRRQAAHELPRATLWRWVATAARLLRPGGVLTAIFRADGVFELIAPLGRDFGAIALMPVHPKPDRDAIRVLVGAVKGSCAPLSIRPALILAAPDGTPTPQAEAVLRHAAALPLVR
jgi:tRNA1(Val) A37 N6-methylase TrmN6